MHPILLSNWDRSVVTVIRLWAGWLGFDSQQEKEISFFFTVSRLAPGPTQPPIYLVSDLTPGVKLQRHEADDPPLSGVRSMNDGAICPLPSIPSWYNV